MLLPRFVTAAAAIAIALVWGGQGHAQTPPGEIKGIDAMGDKTRSANDGWSQAPVPREESASKDAADPGGKSTAENRDRKVPDAPKDTSSATEPQAPMEHRTPSPSGQSPAVPSK